LRAFPLITFRLKQAACKTDRQLSTRKLQEETLFSPAPVRESRPKRPQAQGVEILYRPEDFPTDTKRLNFFIVPHDTLNYPKNRNQ
jgi:hypothetical protein